MVNDLLNEIKREISNRVTREDGKAYKIKERNFLERIRSNKKLKYLLIGLGTYILISYCHTLNKKKFTEDTLHQITVVENKFKLLQTELSKIEEEIENKIKEYEKEIKRSNSVSYENLKKIDVLEKKMNTLESLIENTLKTYKSPSKNFKLENRIEKLEREYSKLKNLQKELEDLKTKFEGIKNLNTLPDAVFVLDMKKDFLALKEARKMGIKTIGISDTNINPDLADYSIPANDDAVSSVKYILEKVKNVILNTKKEIQNKKTKTED